MYSSSSKVYLSTVLVRIIQMPYKQQQVGRKKKKTDDYSALCVCVDVHLRSGGRGLCFIYYYVTHDCFIFREVVSSSHMWLSGHLFFITIALFLIRLWRSPLSFFFPPQTCRPSVEEKKEITAMLLLTQLGWFVNHL